MKKYILFAFILLINVSVKANNLVAQIVLHYETDIFELDAKKQQIIQNQIKELNKAKQNYFVEISGHTDNEGSTYYNEKLSYNRATQIENYFKSKDFEAKHIYISAHAFLKPVSSNNNESGKQLNRRVEVIIYEAINKLDQLGSHQIYEEEIQIDASIKNTVLFKSGLKLEIPPNAFIDSKGELVKGEITLSQKSFNDFKDFILSDIPMSFLNESTDYFSSAGMFDLQATQNNDKLILNNEIQVELPASSSEINTELFVFDNNINQWQTINQELKRVPFKIEYIDTLLRPNYERKEECLNKEYTYYSNNDTLIINEALSFLATNNLKESALSKYVDIKLELDWLKTELKKWRYKESKLNSYPLLKVKNKSKGIYQLDISTQKSVQITNSELKYLRNFIIEVDSAGWNNLKNYTSINKVNLLTVNSSNIQLSFELCNGEFEDFTFNVAARGKTKRFKNYINTLEQYYNDKQNERIRLLKEANQMINNYQIQKNQLELEFYALEQSLNSEQLAQLDLLSQICLIYLKYDVEKQNPKLFRDYQFKEVEFENWYVSIDEENEVLNRLRSIKKEIYCSDFKNANHITSYNEEIRKLYTTKSGKAVADISYAFSINQMGVYNVDRLMKQVDALIVETDKYIDKDNRQISICNLFLVGNKVNGAINFNGSFGYTPYKFLIEPFQSYSIIAVDIHGDTYIMNEKDFMLTIAKQSKDLIMELNLIQTDDNLSLITLK